MPIYEYYCPDNHTVYQFYAKTLAQGQTVPRCPDNPAFRMQKTVSAFAITSGGKKGTPDAEGGAPGGEPGGEPAEDARMEAAIEALGLLGPASQRHMARALESPINAGEAFAVLCHALRSGLGGLAEATAAIARTLPRLQPALVAALEWTDPGPLWVQVAARLPLPAKFDLIATRPDAPELLPPALDALQKDLGNDDFEVIAVNVDTGDDTKPKKFLADTGIEALGYYRDNTLSLFNDLKTRGLALGLPVTLLIDGEGCLLAHMNGPADWAGEDAKRLVGAALP